MERAGLFTTVASPPEVTALLGPIDTVADAALAAYLRGHALQCDAGGYTGQAEAGGWILAAAVLRITDAGVGAEEIRDPREPRRDCASVPLASAVAAGAQPWPISC